MKTILKKPFWKTTTLAVAVFIPLLIYLLSHTNTIGVEEGSNSAATTVKAMQVGWNLGNTLDAYNTNGDAYEILQQKRDKYQIMATYSTKTYSGWDASPASNIPSNGPDLVLNWNITKLNSALNQESGNFSFQIINQDVGDTGSNNLDFTVTKAQFTTKDGAIVTLSDIVGDHSGSIANKVTPYVKSDLTMYENLNTTADVLGGTLTIGIKINNYPMPKAPKVTKEVYYETLWGNPVTTKAMIDEIKKAGFGAVRIPVTYYNHIDSNGNIDPAWLARVKQVVQYVIDNNMYCIINVHHDTGEKAWIKADLSKMDTTVTKYKNIWNQIASFFVTLVVIYTRLTGAAYNIWHHLDNALTGRLLYGAYAFDVYGFSKLGRNISFPEKSFWNGYWLDQIIFDNSYLYLFIVYGSIYFVVISIALYLIGKKMEPIEKIILIGLALFGSMEGYMLNISICFPLIFIGKYLLESRSIRKEIN